MSHELAAYIPSDPLDASRWSRLMARFMDTHPTEAAQEALFAQGDGPTLEHLLEALAGDPEAMAEDHALLAWEALDVDDVEAAQPHFEAAWALAPTHPEVRILEAVLQLEPEARAERLEALATEVRAGLDEESLQALSEGEGVEDLGCLRLHRCLREWAYTLGELDRPADVVALADEIFRESGADAFGIFPLFVHAALQVEDLDILDTWTARMGTDSPALMHWLQAYLAFSQDQPGAAFQSLRRARKATRGVESALFQWEAALPGLADLPEGSEAPDLPLPTDPASAAVVRILGPDLSATPTFMAWLRKMRSMK
ncbi:MAG TPA: hypothetical protein VJ505_02380 [Holophagaceae bacterium]|nr:hypothetical protein [Holophagaceae bacterium]